MQTCEILLGLERIFEIQLALGGFVFQGLPVLLQSEDTQVDILRGKMALRNHVVTGLQWEIYKIWVDTDI